MIKTLPMVTEKVNKNKIAIITINQDGEKLAAKLKAGFNQAQVFNLRGAIKSKVKTIFDEYDGLIFIAALGIIVRLVGPLAKSKLSDPAVVAIDSQGRFVISVLSGHEGGANQLAFSAAACVNAVPVVTTATEARKKLIIGIGTRKGVSQAEVKQAIASVLKKNNIKLNDIRLAATIDLKKNETGLLKACADLGLPLVFITEENIRNSALCVSKSEVVKRHLGLDGVCEPCALLAGRRTRLIISKQILNNVTLAIAREN